MNGPASLADDARSTARRRRTRINAIAVLGALALVAMFVLRAHPLLSADERQLVGRWYTLIVGHDNTELLVWIDEWKPDHSLEIRARVFRRDPDDSGTNWTVSTDPDRSGFSGRWRAANGKCTLVERKQHSLRTLWAQVRTAVRELQWPGSKPEEIDFDVAFTPGGIRELDAGVIFGQRFLLRSVRVPENFVAPDQPLDPAAVLAWWEQQREQKNETANGRE